MKYFTQKLHDEYNSDDKKVFDKASKQWKRNIEAYKAFLDKRGKEFPPKLLFFIRHIDLHDGLILSSSYGKRIKREGKWRRKRKHFFQIQVWHSRGEYIYTVDFSHIRKCEINLSPEESLDEEWAYDEFSITRDNWICFEMWTFSGSTFLIEFKNFNYFRSKADCPPVLGPF